VKVLLVFPPQWTPFRPYLSLPSLYAYLKDKGVDVIQKDFNLEAYDLMLSEGYLSGISQQLRNQFSVWELKDRLAPGTEQKQYNDLFMAKTLAPLLAGKIEAAKNVYRDSQKFYDPEILAGARNTITQALQAVSLAYFPTNIGLSSFEMPSFKGSFQDLKQATQNRLENPYIQLCEEYLLPFVRDEAPGVIGITISGESQLIPALTMARLLKAGNQKAYIVIGGYVVTMLADVIVKYPELFDLFFDSAIINDGEQPLLELIRCVEEGGSLFNVPNLIFRDAAGIHVNDKKPPEDINALPPPNFDGLALEKYLSPEPVLPVLSSRGCYWSRCAFCTHSLAYGMTYQVRDPVKFVDDIEFLVKKHGVKHIALSDEGTSPNSINRIADEILRRGLDVRCSTSIRPERQFTPELCRKMAAAGFREVYIGIESSCDRVLDLINKGTTTAVNEEVLRNMCQAGIWDHVYIMFGFPGETMAEARRTFSFIAQNKDIIRSLGISNFSVGRNSRVMKNPGDYGVTLPRSTEDTDFKLYLPYLVSDGLTDIQGWELTAECLATVATQLAGDAFLEKIGHHYDKACILPQYLSHYEKTDPLLASIFKMKKPARKKTPKTLTAASMPALKPGVVMERLHFNLRAVWENIQNKRAEPVYPAESWSLFDIEGNRFKRISDSGAEMLSGWNGKRPISAIARDLARKYRLPLREVERECLTMAQSLVDEGYALAFQAEN
jgi:anaerobic magnesium-protoporphyrin IX monomethyl ester cyclase